MDQAARHGDHAAWLGRLRYDRDVLDPIGQEYRNILDCLMTWAIAMSKRSFTAPFFNVSRDTVSVLITF